ncbi:MAG: tetratricopeptide repeat protein [Planctomycetota bacterium]|jgi:TolA-binding protein
MPEKDVSQTLAEAKGFFESARKAAETSNFDSAIDMYLKGLRCAPEEVREGHIELRELALQRQGKGGPKPSSAEVTERLGGETALEQMLGAEYLLAKDPGHMPYAETILKAAAAGGYKEAAKWIADLMFLANNNAKKPSLQIYLVLKDSYAAIGQLERAVAACECATKLKRDDVELAEELKSLSAKRTVARGEYDREDVLEAGDYGLSDIEETGNANQVEFMPEKDINSALDKAKVFFERARKVAETNNFDYAINMYLEGLRCAPDALEEGHIPLCELALQRQGKGGKKPSVMERVKRMSGKAPLEQMLNAEYLFAKAPDHLPYAEAMLKAAVAGGYNKTAKWIANLVFQTNNAAKKPSLQTYLLLKDSYEAVGELDKALAACQCGTRLKPEDGELADEFKRLSAELTVARGKYDHEGDFRQSIKDRELQEKLQAQQKVVKTKDYRVSAVEDARGALERDPELAKNIFNLAEALSDLQDDKTENEAIELLENAYKEKSDFSFEQRAGQLRIRQLRRKIREAKTVFETKPGDKQAEARLCGLLEQLNSTELEHYRLCVENYPTDLRARYEYGVRLVQDKKYDEAIPLFQEAQKDPRNKITAMGKIGLCFFMKGWFSDAIDVLTQAIDAYEIKDSGIAKELRYNLGRSYEEQGDTEKALGIYHKIAQLDFAYKDVRRRIDELRRK